MASVPDIRKYFDGFGHLTADKKIPSSITEWISFADGFDKSMYIFWSYDNYYFLTPVDPATNPDYPYNYIWSSNQGAYRTENCIKPYCGTFRDWFGDFPAKPQGQHRVRDFCRDAKYRNVLYN